MAALALVGFLVLHRERAFWKALGIVTAWSAGGLAVLGVVSHIRGGYLARYLEDLILQIQAGVWSGALYWLIWWLVLVCALLSAWDLARFLGRTQGEARALALKNQLVMENYRALEQKLRESAQLRHGFAHQVTALDAMVQARDWAGLERWVAARKAEAGDQSRYTEHIAVNAILQDAAARARGLGIPFQVSVAVPRELFVPDEDLCALLMNLLDNALEGAARTPAGAGEGHLLPDAGGGELPPHPVREHLRRTGEGRPPGPPADPEGRPRLPTASAWPRCGPWRRSTAASWTSAGPRNASPSRPPCKIPWRKAYKTRGRPAGRPLAFVYLLRWFRYCTRALWKPA